MRHKIKGPASLGDERRAYADDRFNGSINCINNANRRKAQFVRYGYGLSQTVAAAIVKLAFSAPSSSAGRQT